MITDFISPIFSFKFYSSKIAESFMDCYSSNFIKEGTTAPSTTAASSLKLGLPTLSSSFVKLVLVFNKD